MKLTVLFLDSGVVAIARLGITRYSELSIGDGLHYRSTLRRASLAQAMRPTKSVAPLREDNEMPSQSLVQSRTPVWRSTIAMKIGMAITGLIFIAYVVAHLYGNLKVYVGQESFDTYAHHLRTLGEPYLPYAGFLSISRAVLVASLILHVTFAIVLWHLAREARPIAYAAKPKRSTSAASRSMRWGGFALLAFIIFHIGNLTTHTFKTYPETDSPYERLIYSFQPGYWWVILIYLAAQVALALHVRHGLYSSLQTLGLLRNARQRRIAHGSSIALATLLFVGYSSIPIAVVAGLGS